MNYFLPIEEEVAPMTKSADLNKPRPQDLYMLMGQHEDIIMSKYLNKKLSNDKKDKCLEKIRAWYLHLSSKGSNY